MEAQAPLWARLLPLGDRKRVLGLVFILTVALIWVAASFFVQGIEAQGAHPAVLTLVANSLFAVYVPVYFLNLRLRRRRQASGAMQQQLETSALVPARQPRSDEGEGDAVPAPLPRLAAEDSHNGKAAAAPPMPLKQLFRAALVVSAGGQRRAAPCQCQTRACFQRRLGVGCCSRSRRSQPGPGPYTAPSPCPLNSWLPASFPLLLPAGGPAVVPGPAHFQHVPCPHLCHLQHHPLLHLCPLHLPLCRGPPVRGLHAVEAGIHPAAGRGCGLGSAGQGSAGQCLHALACSVSRQPAGAVELQLRQPGRLMPCAPPLLFPAPVPQVLPW